ncbi:MAG: bifunctional hydroxymethylpyrimidine kinase/phosphomethylpyrimidine kinase [Candidatus Tectomicrobia bacterium]|nr:bifunctional hydroxymethylpyrimidine kinase/phosphomethylpyrimidine kinase [Candidatus Tectomicrobia bacterium]
MALPFPSGAHLPPVALTIAGSDSGGGAGIQADLKTFCALGVYGASVLTALTAQNTVGVQGVHTVPPEFIAQQFDSVCTDLPVAAAKVGMLATSEVIGVVARKIRQHRLERLVVDPVMVAKSGDRLLAPEAREALVRQLLPLAEVLTPNAEEARDLLGGKPIQGLDDMKEAARALHRLGPRHVLLKGGHITRGAADVLFDGEEITVLEGRRVDTPHTHGTGCTLSSAIAAGLALGLPVREAVRAAKEYIQGAIENALALGKGRGPLNHMYRSCQKVPA